MAKLVHVKLGEVKKAHESLKKEIAKNPEAKKLHEELVKETKKLAAKEKKRLDAEHAANKAREG